MIAQAKEPSKRTIGEASDLNRDHVNALYKRAKLAYDAYTVAAGTHSPVPFISLWDQLPQDTQGRIDAACDGHHGIYRLKKSDAGHLLDGQEWRQMPEVRR